MRLQLTLPGIADLICVVNLRELLFLPCGDQTNRFLLTSNNRFVFAFLIGSVLKKACLQYVCAITNGLVVIPPNISLEEFYQFTNKYERLLAE